MTDAEPVLGKITEKLWGMEIVTGDCSEQNYTGKILILNPGYISSIHRHGKKHETFHVLDGTVCVSFYDISDGEVKDRLEWVMYQGFRIEVPPGTWHSFSAMVPSRIIETSTHHDESDVERYIASRRLV